MKNIIYALLVAVLFGTLSCKKDKYGPQTSTVTDVEGNVYKTIKIGDQWWMAENLKTHKLNDGTSINYVENNVTWSDPNLMAPMLCYYNNDVANNKDKYGALYNWYAVNTGKLAPAGWHVATDADWQKLQDYLIANGYNYDGSKVDNKIAKSLATTTGWTQDASTGNVGNEQASNNKSGFNGLSAGYRAKTGTFGLLGNSAYWWSNSNSYHLWGIEYNQFQLLSAAIEPNTGFAIRCVKD